MASRTWATSGKYRRADSKFARLGFTETAHPGLHYRVQGRDATNLCLHVGDMIVGASSRPLLTQIKPKTAHRSKMTNAGRLKYIIRARAVTNCEPPSRICQKDPRAIWHFRCRASRPADGKDCQCDACKRNMGSTIKERTQPTKTLRAICTGLDSVFTSPQPSTLGQQTFPTISSRFFSY